MAQRLFSSVNALSSPELRSIEDKEITRLRQLTLSSRLLLSRFSHLRRQPGKRQCQARIILMQD